MTKDFASIAPEPLQFEKLATGFQFIEGPIWFAAENHLIFSDIYGDTMYKWSEAGGLETFRQPSQKANGNALDKQGRIVSCEHLTRGVTRTEKDGTIVTLASRYQGKSLNSPNDVVIKSNGDIYFTDPTSGIVSDKAGKIRPQELDFSGVFKMSPDGSNLTCITKEFTKPNGLAFSPDESVLYVNDTTDKFIKAFDVLPDGGIANGRVFARLEGDKPGVPDGLKVDREGNVYCSGPGPGIWVFNTAGEYLGTILPPEKAANFGWGDSDWRTLYLCASTSLYRVRLGIPGIAIP